jgi:hypothetical protein
MLSLNKLILHLSIWAVRSSRANNSFEYWITTVWGAVYPFIVSLREEQPYESSQQNSGYAGITSSGWVPILPQQPRVVYSMQQCLPMSNIPTTPAIVTVSQVQALPVVCQPQVSQVVMQQPLVPATQPQSPT